MPKQLSQQEIAQHLNLSLGNRAKLASLSEPAWQTLNRLGFRVGLRDPAPQVEERKEADPGKKDELQQPLLQDEKQDCQKPLVAGYYIHLEFITRIQQLFAGETKPEGISDEVKDELRTCFNSPILQNIAKAQLKQLHNFCEQESKQSYWDALNQDFKYTPTDSTSTEVKNIINPPAMLQRATTLTQQALDGKVEDATLTSEGKAQDQAYSQAPKAALGKIIAEPGGGNQSG